MRSRYLTLSMIALGALPVAGCASYSSRTHDATATIQSETVRCGIASASPWIQRWFAAWDLTSRRILRLPEAPPADIVFYDDTCVYTTSAVTAGGAPPVDESALRGTGVPWRALAHGGSLTLPDSSEVPIQLMSFTNIARHTGPFFVMAAPSYWAQMGHGQEPGLTGIFLHEFAHTRQVRGMQRSLGPIDSTWAFPEELDDDAVQTHFGADSIYVAAYIAERDLLYRAAQANSLTEVRALAGEALSMMRSRHARWFTGDNAVFATLDNIFLALEGVGQWTGYAWLAHPEGGGLNRDSAITTILGRRRSWVQDEGLALFLVVDRLLPEWPLLEFSVPSMGALDLLERAVQR